MIMRRLLLKINFYFFNYFIYIKMESDLKTSLTISVLKYRFYEYLNLF